MALFNLEEQKPLMAMVATQFIYAIMNLVSKAAFNRGFSTMAFVVYRQSIATLFLIPATLLAKHGRISELSLSLKGFGLVFLASLAGATMNQSLYYQGVRLGSPSMAAAMANLIPAITFVMAASVGLERVKLRSLRSWAKIIGTIICVGGAMTMALFKGPRLLNTSFQNLMVIFRTSMDKWIIGGLCLMGSSSFWSLWLILQVPICKSHSDPLSLAAWMCFMSALQSAAVTFFIHPDLSVWRFTSLSDVLACLYAGSFGSAVTFYLQSWCISVRGPLYSAMFNPLSTIITTVLSSILLHEELHIGSLFGAIAIIGGLYIVLWGKAEDLKIMEEQGIKDFAKISISIDKSSNCETDIHHPLLADKLERED
ncbi:WAT1-related protein [Rhynchospora pubera]|uniref:WAT1-related protein n=1 Tax=Rhynchospora pubera TaxID=906938 RepID=A0AAV8D1S8_9POAL|nr:WAT1-related protein [Rhynchospora pubera]